MQYQFNGVNYVFTNTQIFVAAAVLVVVVLFVVAAYLEHRKSKTLAFRKRYGAEYDRAVLDQGSVNKAETKLADRETRVEALNISDLSLAKRERFVTEWHTVESRFVDHPKSAVSEADELVTALLEARGYPQANFEQRAADVSVGYPLVMGNYRQAHSVADRPGRVEATTEELRAAMIQYRTLFDELIQVQRPSEQRVAA